jgi:6-phosphogluconolactonase (cycloisomerase 2 family)
MLKKAAALFLVCASTAIWVSCGATSNRYLYAAIPGSNQIVIYREDPNSGILTQLAGSPITAGSAVESIVIHPSNKFLFTANAGEGDVSLYTIAATGALDEVTPRTVVGTSPTLLAMDSGGSFLYVGNSGSQNISVFSINASSNPPTLTPVLGSPFQIGMSPINMKVSPSGNALYVTGTGSPGFIEVFSLNQGVPSVVSGSPFVTGAGPYGLMISSSGGFLYLANKLDNSISEFTVNSDGSLTQFSNSPIGEQYSGPVSLLIDKSGKYMYVANQGSTNLGAYSIGSDGALTLLTNSPFATGAEPTVLALDAGGKYLFVGNQSSPAVQSFSLDTGSGTLTSVNTYTLPGTPTSIAVTP